MDTLDAANHYADALRNFAEKMDYNPDSISVHREDSLDGRYGRVPKVIWETGTFRLMGSGEIETPYGFMDLTNYGLDPDKLSGTHIEPYNSAVLCFYED